MPNRLKPNRLETLRRALQTVRDEDPPAHLVAAAIAGRSEERRVGKECRSRWSPYH